MISGHYWSIQNESRPMGITTGQPNRFYLVGFSNEDIARRVASKSNPLVEPKLRRSMAENVSLDVKRSMMQMNLPIAGVADTISIDVMAELSIIKKTINDNIVYPVSTLVKHDMQNLFMMPFDSGIGVIMPHELVRETSYDYQFMCHVIDPCDMRDTLKRLFNNI